MAAKWTTIASTIELGVHGGKVHPETSEWEPRVTNGIPSEVDFTRERYSVHTGQLRFDIPKWWPYFYFLNDTR